MNSRNLSFLLLGLICLFSFRLQADTTVVDQNGKTKEFFRDVVGEGSVIVNFIYTHCEGVCPGQGRRFQQLQEKLGDRLGREVRLISVSIDPERDTPKALKAWSESFHAGEHWTLVTGTKKAMEDISLQILGLKANRDEHSPYIAVRKAKDPWQRLYGLSPVRSILSTLQEG